MQEDKIRTAELSKRQLEYEEEFKGKSLSKKEWQNFFKLPDKLHGIGSGKAHALFDRSEYVDPIKRLSKQLRDDVVFGKPLFQKYARPLKPEDLNYEMGGTFKPFKVMH